MYTHKVGAAEFGFHVLHGGVDGVALRCGVHHYIIFEGLNEQQVVVFDTDEAAAVLHKNDVRVLLVFGQASQKLRFLANLLFLAVLVQRHFDGGLDVHVLEWLQDVAMGFGHFGFVQRAFIGVRRQENHRNVHVALDFFCSSNAVHVALDHDVHQRQIRLVLHGHVDGVFAIVGRSYNVVAQVAEAAFDVFANDAFVFGYENVDWHVK